MTRSARGVGRPSTQVLTEERILEAAFRLGAESTPRQFTMTALARSLGVRTSALYHYFANRDAVIRAMRGRISRDVAVPAQDGAPIEEVLLEWARRYRRTAIASPQITVMLAISPIDADDDSFAVYERLAVLLTDDGWHTSAIVDAVVALESFIIGSALDALAPQDNMSPGDLAADYPTFSAAERERAQLSADPAERTFEVGARALIHGLSAWARGEAGGRTS